MTIQKGAQAAAVVEEDLVDEDIHDEESAVDKFLGDSFSLERTGVIRPGIMTPKNGCPENKIGTYNSMVGTGASWKDISAVLGTDSNGKSWLTMRNVDYFTLRPSDCQNPAHAAKVKELYMGDEGVLKKIPISFPFDDLNKMIDVRLSAYTAGGLVASGRYQGNSLICEQPKQGDSKVKSFGRPEFNTKPCDPDKCQLYQAKKCKMRGGFIFRIPKVPGLGVWALYTSSFYTLRGIRDKMWAIKQMLNGWGSLSTLPTGAFYLNKIKKRVGADQKEQWLVTIDTDLAVDDIVEQVKEEHFRSHPAATVSVAVRKLNGKETAKCATAAPAEMPTPPAAVTDVFPDAETVTEGAAQAEASYSVPERPEGPVEAPKAPAAEEKQAPAAEFDGDWPAPPSQAAQTPPAPQAPAPQPEKKAASQASAPASQAAKPQTPPQKTPPAQSTPKPQTPAQQSKPAGATPPAPAAGTGKQDSKPVIPKNLESFAEAISKNPALKGKSKDDVLKAVDGYCTRILKKGLYGIDAKEATTLISFLQTDLKQGKIAEKLFAAV